VAPREVKVRLRQRLKWWVIPMIRVMKFNHSIGIPFNPDRVVEIIVEHGVYIEVEPE
jgi:hypothetical protein